MQRPLEKYASLTCQLLGQVKGYQCMTDLTVGSSVRFPSVHSKYTFGFVTQLRAPRIVMLFKVTVAIPARESWRALRKVFTLTSS